jgi:hypothetical protein
VEAIAGSVRDFAGAARPLLLEAGVSGYELREGPDGQLLGRLSGSAPGTQLAEAAGGSWQLYVARKRFRLGWSIVAEAVATGEAAACYYQSWIRRGGALWLSADHWGALRPRSFVGLDPTWKLTLEGELIARVRRVGSRRVGTTLEMSIHSAPVDEPGLSLLILTTCWTVIVLTFEIPSGGGGGGGG